MEKITKVGVLGAGTMGSAIAQHFCMKGLNVVMVDAKAEACERGRKLIQVSLEEAASKKVLSADALAQALSRLQVNTDKAAFGDCQLVVEAVFEDLHVKKQVFAELEKYVKPNTWLASNTSSFLITDIAAGLKNPERVVGVHYFYHAAKNKLVEVIPGAKTDKEIVTGLMNFYSFIDKTPILVGDAPGFAVNRYFVPWLNEAARLFEEGLGSQAFIDQVAMQTFKIGMGPFALMNATGVPIACHAADGLAMKLGKFYAPAQVLKEQTRLNQNWPITEDQAKAGGQNNESEVRERLCAAAFAAAIQMLNEKVCDVASCEIGARVGLRWARGPFEMINKMGVKASEAMVARLLSRWGVPAATVPTELVKNDKTEIEWIRSETYGKTGFLIFNLPDKMNPLSEATVSQLAAKFDALDARADLETIVLAGSGKAFVAGADIKFFVDCMEKKDLERIYKFTEGGQRLLNRIEKSKKKTVAYLNGLTLGGGLELALACQYRWATPKAMLAFPETGIGIYPGLGGTQRAARLIGKGLAKYLISTGQMVTADLAYKYGLVDRLQEPVMDLRDLAKNTDWSHAKKSGSFAEEGYSEYDGSLDPAVISRPPLATSEKLLRRKAPVALKTAMRLVDEGMKCTLDEGLKLELSGLKEIFGTQDAMIGLTSLMKKSKPEYVGK